MASERRRGRSGHFLLGARRMQRGDVRTAVLAVLAERSCHGYELIQELEERSRGAWRPSPGSIYPTLQALEDEGLVSSSDREGKRVYDITESGRAEAERRLTEAGGAPWDFTDTGDLWTALKALMVAVKQVDTAGTAKQIDEATQLLSDVRKQLYRLLAED